MTYDYDLFTIGAGSGGVRASRRAATLGARVAVAEDRFLGGTCVNVGCVPKKLLVYGASYRQTLREATGFGWRGHESAAHSEDEGWSLLRDAVQREVKRLNEVYRHLLAGAGCSLHWGRARLVDPHTVEVAGPDGTQQFTAERILIATGGTPVRPAIHGSEHAWVSDDVFQIPRRPRKLIVVGGGYIGLEMASIFLGLGSEVTLVHRGAHVLSGFDDDARAFVAHELSKKGLDFQLNTSVQSLERTDNDTLCVTLARGNSLFADAVLFAIGRSPNSDGLGLADAGVHTDGKGAVVVDTRFQTSAPSVYAIGDVVGRMALTPVALAEGEALAAALYGKGDGTMDYEGVPTAVFASPPLACVGLGEATARERYPRVHTYSTEFKSLRHTVSGESERMFVKVLVDAASDRVIGVHLVGADAPEIIQGFAVAMKAGATKAQFDATVGLHPTSAEELVTLREPTGG